MSKKISLTTTASKKDKNKETKNEVKNKETKNKGTKNKKKKISLNTKNEKISEDVNKKNKIKEEVEEKIEENKVKTINTKQENPNIKMEKILMGASVLDEEVLMDNIEKFKKEDFILEKNQILFDILEKMVKNNKIIDVLTLKSELESNKKLDEIGGLEYISEITNLAIITFDIKNLTPGNFSETKIKNKNKKETKTTNIKEIKNNKKEEFLENVQKNVMKEVNGIIEKVEKSLLGAMILETDFLLENIEKIEESDFVLKENQIIYMALGNLVVAQEEIDTLSLKQELNWLGYLEEVGGIEYLTELTDLAIELTLTNDITDFLKLDHESKLNKTNNVPKNLKNESIEKIMKVIWKTKKTQEKEKKKKTSLNTETEKKEKEIKKREETVSETEELISETLDEEVNKIEKAIDKRISKEIKNNKTVLNINDKSVLDKEKTDIKTTSKKTLDTANQKVKEELANEDSFKWDRDFFNISEEGEITFDKSKMEEITPENYYSMKTNFQYMNSTQYGNWIECEAQEKAVQDGIYQRPLNRTFILGNYVHSWNDGTMEEYIEENYHHLFKKGGEPYADVLKCDAVIETFQNDRFINFLLKSKTSQKEVIAVAYFAGTWWKVRVDDLNLDKKRIIDLKTSGGIHNKYWDEEDRKYVNFVEHYNYMRQMAIYEKAVREHFDLDERLEVLLIVGEKEYVADKMVVNVTDHDRFDYENRRIEENMKRILRVKYGLEEPNRCEQCEYCKKTKQLTKPVYYKDIKIN